MRANQKNEKRCQAKTTKKEDEPAPMAQFSSTPLAAVCPRKISPAIPMCCNFNNPKHHK